ncbi:cleavage and polyadenylation specificity factor subunit 1-like isoform X2 [Crassostrea virginica]
MYSIYKQTHPPTGIEHCVYCNFFNLTERNLVISAVNKLYVYRLNPDTEDEKNEKDEPRKPDYKPKQKMECLAHFTLFGNIMSMKCVKLPGALRDSLLLSFSEAKLSVVEYDPGTHDLQTTSLHYFEESSMKGGFFTNYCIPEVRVDPDGRCAAMLVYGTHMVILPFRRDVMVEEGENLAGVSKSPILSSYIIDLRNFDEKIINVKDFQFLHGYYEPTVFILFEPLQTWAGRTAVRADTCSIVAISLNLQEKVHPIIWSLGSLPFDCCQVLAVPRPIGGVIIIAVNSLLYLNQSVPPYGVSLNSISAQSTLFPLRIQEGVRIALDCCQASFMSYDKIVLSLKGGELYVLTLVVDGMRSVRSFNFDKSAASVLTSCMCVCEDGFLFLGSRLGNSLLLKYTEKASENLENGDLEKKKEDEPVAKKKKTEGSTEIASDVSQLENLYDLEVYGSAENPTSTTITSYTFEVCDNIWNIGPCGNIVMGEPAFLSEEFSSCVDPDIEMVMTSGYGKNGALSVLQRSIRPQVVTTFELPGCLDMWTVKSIVPGEKKEDRESTSEDDSSDNIEGGHSFLILSRSDSSMILETGQEMNELDHSGFSTQTTTIYAGNIGGDRYILQVSDTSLRLLEGVRQIQHIPLDSGSPVVQCSVADPYIVLLTQEGQILMFTLRTESVGLGVRLVVGRPSISQHSRVEVISAYKDVSGLFTCMNPTDSIPTAPDVKAAKTVAERSFSIDAKTADEEDELLYGDSDTTVFQGSLNTSQTSESESPTKEKKQSDTKPTYWLILCRENGVLEIYSIPDYKIVYYVKNFPLGQKLLVDSVQITDKISSGGERQEKINAECPALKELLMVGLGYKDSRPHLLARVEDDLYIYEAFGYPQSSIDNHLKLRFKKIQHGLILREKRTKSKKKDPEEFQKEEKKVGKMRYFRDIAGYSGVFICGAYPHWIFVTSRGSLRIHPMGIDGPVWCFSEFHNINCPHGFLYFNRMGELRISVLPTHLTYDAPWPVRKVPLRCTPHFVAYHFENKIYAVVTSTPEICNKLPKTTTEEREWDTIEKDERFIYPTTPRFTLQLYSPTSWEVVPNTKIECEEWEHVVTMKTIRLRSEETLSGLKSFIVMGTNLSLGEEVTSRGRVIIADIIEVVPEPGMPLTKHKIKTVYEKEQKGPVTAIADINGLLITAIGQKLYIWQLKDNDLMGVAFIDTQIYIHTLVTIKHIILAGDILKSVQVYQYQEEHKVLSIVSRDPRPLEVYTADYLIDNTQLCCLVSDRMKNLIVYSYQPEARESHGGQRLIRKADFNAGSHINSMFRVRCKLYDPSSDKRMTGAPEKRHITYFATLDGSLGFVLPLSEKVYRRLFMLQNALVTHIPHIAGLNPRSYRQVIGTFPELRNSQKNILDGELLWKYTNLSIMEKIEIAKRLGTSNDQIMDDLMEIDRLTAHF